MLHRRNIVAAGLICCGLVPGVGCRHRPLDFRHGELVVLIESAPIHLDPRLATDQASGRVFELMLSGLVTKSASGEIRPDLATDWQILDDGRRYRFSLRPGALFHDGRPVTADDVVWTFQTLLDGTVASPKKGAFPQLHEVVAVDDGTVDFLLTEPYGALLPNLTSFLGIIPAGSDPTGFQDNPVGSGPFRFVERAPDRIVLERNPHHWAGAPRLKRVILREVPDATVRALELRKGSAHLVVNALPPDVVVKLRQDRRFRIVESPGSNYAYLGINLEDPLLGRVEVRRAIALSLDRELLVASLLRGMAVTTETVLRPGHWARHRDLAPLPYDPAAARSMLDAAGLRDPDGSGPQPRFALVYKTSTDETALLQAQIVQSMLAEVGIEIQIRSHEFATFYADIKRGSFQIFSLTWTGIADPDIYSLILHSARIPPRGSNRGRYRNPEFDRLVEAGARGTTREQRRPFYLVAQEVFARDLPYISLYIKSNVAVMRRELAGYENYPGGELYGLKDVSWEEGGT